jgi:hypothetical protein
MVSKTKIFLGVILLALLVMGCTPRKSASQSATEAVETVQAALTMTASAAPSETPTATSTATLTATIAPTVTLATTPSATLAAAGQTGGAATNLSSCDRAAFVSDVTIPDGTVLTAGSSFTKTWQLKNDGTCGWDSTYQVVFYSGNQMGAPISQALTTSTIAPGQTVNISVTMTAPTVDGTYYGYWVLQNASGQNFGVDSAGSPFYVQVVVGAGGAATSTAPSATEAPTVAPTSEG